MAALYPLDDIGKIKGLLKKGNLLYSKYTKADVSTDKAPGLRGVLSPELMPQLASVGFRTHTITEEDLVKGENANMESFSVDYDYRNSRRQDGEKSSADDRRRATHLAASYALDSFGGLKEVGAALDDAIARRSREFKAFFSICRITLKWKNVKNKPTTLVRHSWLRQSRRESNPHLPFRRGPFYPLNYGTKRGG